jgi:hypothetical protein
MPEHRFDVEFLCEMEAELSPPEMIGPVPEGTRITFHIKGGTFEGPKLRGRIRPVGADWFILRNDQVGQLDVRATIETDDGELIYVYYYGLVDFPDEIKRELAQGIMRQGEKYRIITNPIFRTSSPKYSWLNSTFAVGVGETGENRVKYTIYRLK